MNEWIDIKRAREICGGDGKLYLSLVKMFLETFDEMNQDILSSLNGDDPSSIEDSIHKLKGACRNLAASAVVDLLQAAEEQARLGKRAEAVRHWEKAQEPLQATLSYFMSLQSPPF